MPGENPNFREIHGNPYKILIPLRENATANCGGVVA
jgi:hypothetical protein